MNARTVATVAVSGVALTGFAAARAAHQTTEPHEQQRTPGRSVARSALVGAAAVPVGLAYMYPFTPAGGDRRYRAIMVAAGGLQFAAMAGLVNYMNHNGVGSDGGWNSVPQSMLLSGVTGAAFGAGGALLAKGGGKAAARWGAIGFVGGLPDGGWLQLFNRPGHDGLHDFGRWIRGEVPR